MTQRLFNHNPQIILGRLCLLCSTLNFLNLYGTVPGIVCPATLVSCLPQVSSLIQKGQQQCAAEFFQEFCRVLGHTANQYKSQNLIPANCNLAFLRSFFFELRSEVMCSSCSSVASTTTMETILPLHKKTRRSKSRCRFSNKVCGFLFLLNNFPLQSLEYATYI